MTIEELKEKIQSTLDGIRRADSAIEIAYNLDLLTGSEPDPTICVIKHLDDRMIKLLTKAEQAVNEYKFNEALRLTNKCFSLMKISTVITGYATQD